MLIRISILLYSCQTEFDENIAPSWNDVVKKEDCSWKKIKYGESSCKTDYEICGNTDMLYNELQNTCLCRDWLFFNDWICSDSDLSKYIKWIIPADVYLNMEEQWFSTETKQTELWISWFSKLTNNGISYEVYTFSDNPNKVVSVVWSVMINEFETKNIIETQPFFIYLSTLNYTDSNSKKVQDWLKENYNTNSILKVWDVTFTISAPSDYVRILRIEIL